MLVVLLHKLLKYSSHEHVLPNTVEVYLGCTEFILIIQNKINISFSILIV